MVGSDEGDTVIITRSQFLSVMPLAKGRVDLFLQPLNEAVERFEINTAKRLAEFLPQLAHESAQFKYMRELADGSAYEGRLDLGNTEPGDGKRFRGRGPIQITGRKNVGLCSMALFGDNRLLENPELLESPQVGCASAGWFWVEGAGLNLSRQARSYGVPAGCNLNDLADAGDFEGITLAINGGRNGIEDRMKYRVYAVTAFGGEGSVA